MLVRKVLTTSDTPNKNFVVISFESPPPEETGKEAALSGCLITQLLQRSDNDSSNADQDKDAVLLEELKETSGFDLTKKFAPASDVSRVNSSLSLARKTPSSIPGKEKYFTSTLVASKIPNAKQDESYVAARSTGKSSNQTRASQSKRDLTPEKVGTRHSGRGTLGAESVREEESPDIIASQNRNSGEESTLTLTRKQQNDEKQLEYREDRTRFLSPRDAMPSKREKAAKTGSPASVENTMVAHGSRSPKLERRKVLDYRETKEQQVKFSARRFSEPIPLVSIPARKFVSLSPNISRRETNSPTKSVISLAMTSQRMESVESGNVLDCQLKKSRRFDKKRITYLPSISKSAPISLQNTAEKEGITLEGKPYSPSSRQDTSKDNTTCEESSLNTRQDGNISLPKVEPFRYKSRFRVKLLPLGQRSDSLPELSTTLTPDFLVSKPLSFKTPNETSTDIVSDIERSEAKISIKKVSFENASIVPKMHRSLSLDSIFSTAEPKDKSFLGYTENRIKIKGSQVLPGLKQSEEKKFPESTLRKDKREKINTLEKFVLPLPWR